MAAENLRTVHLLGTAIVAGLVTAALLWHAPLGLSWFVLVALFVPVILRGLTRRPTTPAVAWGFATVWLAGCVAWRASEWTFAIAWPCSALMLATLPILVRHRLGWRELGELPARTIAWLLAGPAAAGTARRRLATANVRANRRVLGGLAIGFPISMFAALLLSADPRFAAAASSILAGGDQAVSFAFFTIVASTVYLIGYLALDRMHPGVLAALRHPALLGRVAVPRVTTIGDSPYRSADAHAAVDMVPRTLAPLTWVVVLGQLILVFGLFVFANLGELFGGHELVRAVGTRTYAEHLHAGFAEVTTATLLAVAVVMFGHRFVAQPSVRAHARLFAALEVALLLLTAVTLASCWQRLSIYMDAYGTTYLRLAVMLVQAAVLGLLVLGVLRSLARRWWGHDAALVTLAVVLAVVAGSMNADLVVARANLQRLVDAPETATSTGLDERYLETLGVDALPALDDPHVPAELAEHLRTTWLAREYRMSENDWRGIRGLGSGG